MGQMYKQLEYNSSDVPSVIAVRIGGQPVIRQLLADSGATVEMLKLSALNKYYREKIVPAHVNISGVTTGELQVLGVCLVPVEFYPGFSINVNFIIVKDENTSLRADGIVGRKFMAENKIFFVDENKKLIINGRKVNLQVMSANNSVEAQALDRHVNSFVAKPVSSQNKASATIRPHRAFAYAEFKIPPRSIRIIKIRTQKPLKCEAVFVPDEISGLAMPESLHVFKGHNRKTFAHVTNMSDLPIIIHRHQKLGEIHKSNEEAFAMLVARSERQQLGELNVLSEQPDLSHVPSDFKQPLLDLISKYDDIFAKPGEKLRTTTKGTAPILTGNHSPIYTRQFPIPAKLLDPLNAEIERLLEIGVIRPATSNHWNSPLFLVSKRDHTTNRLSHRAILDFRRINAVTETIRYETPNSERLSNRVFGRQLTFFSLRFEKCFPASTYIGGRRPENCFFCR